VFKNCELHSAKGLMNAGFVTSALAPVETVVEVLFQFFLPFQFHLVHLQFSIPQKVGTHCHNFATLRTDIGGGGSDAITAIIKVGEFIIEHNLSVTVRASKIHFSFLLNTHHSP
jgi:hypothetical protein